MLLFWLEQVKHYLSLQAFSDMFSRLAVPKTRLLLRLDDSDAVISYFTPDSSPNIYLSIPVEVFTYFAYFGKLLPCRSLAVAWIH